MQNLLHTRADLGILRGGWGGGGSGQELFEGGSGSWKRQVRRIFIVTIKRNGGGGLNP